MTVKHTELWLWSEWSDLCWVPFTPVLWAVTCDWIALVWTEYLCVSGTEDWREEKWRIGIKRSSRRCTAASSWDRTASTHRHRAAPARSSSDTGPTGGTGQSISSHMWTGWTLIDSFKLSKSYFTVQNEINSMFWYFLKWCVCRSVCPPAGGSTGQHSSPLPLPLPLPRPLPLPVIVLNVSVSETSCCVNLMTETKC